MRIAKAIFIQPDRNAPYAVGAMALSFFVFAYSARFGQVSILAYYALWLPLVLLDYRRVLGNYARYGWLFAFAIFACLSVFWSAAPAVTARAGVQYMSHIVCALIAMRVVSLRSMVRGAVTGVILVLLYSLAFGSYQLDVLDGTVSFVGAFSSKNQLGFYASLGLYFAFAGVFVLAERGRWLICCLVGGMISGYCLLACQSATSVITTAAVIALVVGLRPFLMLAPRHRQVLFWTAGVGSILLAATALYFGAADLLLGAFGKDSTLTGRTYLWQQGMEAARLTPMLGVGYQAYWVQGFPEAERLWREFYITARGGFHFHNTYIETAVETGLVGMLLLSGIFLATIVGHLSRLLGDRRNNEAYVFTGIVMLLLVRSFVEIDILTPYHVGTFLFYFSAGRLAVARPKYRSVQLHRHQHMEPAHP